MVRPLPAQVLPTQPARRTIFSSHANQEERLQIHVELYDLTFLTDLPRHVTRHKGLMQVTITSTEHGESLAMLYFRMGHRWMVLR